MISTIRSFLENNRIIDLETDHLTYLATIPQPEYESIIIKLLNMKDDTPCINGCVLFTLRPNILLYRNILWGAIHVEDPSWNIECAIALVQVVPPYQVARDLIGFIKNPIIANPLKINILSLFYWVMLKEKFLIDYSWYKYLIAHRSWVMHIVYESNKMIGSTECFPDIIPRSSLSLSNNIENEYPSIDIDRIFPYIDKDKARNVLYEIIQRLIALFINDKTGIFNKISMELLVNIDIHDYPDQLRKRIINTYILANRSSNPDIRKLVSTPSQQALINSYT